jgi:hypothetical protein
MTIGAEDSTKAGGTTMRSWKAYLATCFALAMLVSAALAPQAMANRESCPSGFICLWNGPTFGEERVDFHDLGFQNLGPAITNRASSVYNNSGRWVKLFKDIAGGGGEPLCQRPGASMSLEGTIWNNTIESIRIENEGRGICF